MLMNQSAVCFSSGSCVREKLRTEYSRTRHFWLECPYSSQHFAPIVSRHSPRSNLARPLVHVQVRGTIHGSARIGQVHGTLCVMGKAREKFSRDGNYLMRLSARLRHFSCYNDVLAITVHAPEGVAGKSSGGSLLPSHHHSGVQPPCQGHPDAFLATEIPGKILRKDLAQFLVIGFWLQRRLLFPFSRLEVRS